jgi:hypothetical protein
MRKTWAQIWDLNISALFLISLWCVFAYCLASHLAIVFAPWQLEYREGAVLFQIAGQLKHLPVYATDKLPIYLNLYGSIYNTLGTWVCNIFGLGFQPLRTLSFVAILCSLAMFADILRRRRVAGPARLALTLSLYIGLLFQTTPLARPDALAFLMYMFCFWLFEVFSPTVWVVLTIILVADLDLLTKQYFVLIAPLVISYVILYKSKVRGLVYAVIFVASVALVYRLDMHFLPGYLPLTIAVNSGATPKLSIGTTMYMLKQTAAYLVTCGAALLVCAAYARVAKLRTFAFANLSFPAYASAVVILALSLKLGHHNGAWLTYYIHLLSPVLLVAIAPTPPVEAPDTLARKLALVCSVAVVSLLAWKAVLSPWQNVRIGRELAVLAKDMQPYATVLATPEEVSSLVQQNKAVYVSGQSNFFYGAAMRGGLRLPGLTLTAAGAQVVQDQYEQDVADRIANKRFDLVITDAADNRPKLWTSLIGNHYRVIGTRKVGKLTETEWVPVTPGS